MFSDGHMFSVGLCCSLSLPVPVYSAVQDCTVGPVQSWQAWPSTAQLQPSPESSQRETLKISREANNSFHTARLTRQLTLWARRDGQSSRLLSVVKTCNTANIYHHLQNAEYMTLTAKATRYFYKVTSSSTSFYVLLRTNVVTGARVRQSVVRSWWLDSQRDVFSVSN